MGLRVLWTERLRNLQPQAVELGPGLNLFCGDNAQGKSNFLEAIGLLCTARSFRGSRNAEIVQFGETDAAVEGLLEEDGDTCRLRLAMDRKHKFAFADRQRIAQMVDYLGRTPPVVFFRSESLGIGRGEPDLRRQFLDGLLVGSQPVHLGLLRRYERALYQRNTALKAAWKAAEMVGFERELAISGVRILEQRRKLVAELGRVAAEFQKEFGENLEVRYRSSFETTEELDEERYLGALKEDREQDRRQGFTRRGPHRDDLKLELDGRSVRRFGSQGQVRSVVLSLKVAEIEILAAARGGRPLLILDDVSADIDEKRRERLFDYVAKDLQAFVSTTEAGALKLQPERCRRFEVQQGQVHQTS